MYADEDDPTRLRCRRVFNFTLRDGPDNARDIRGSLLCTYKVERSEIVLVGLQNIIVNIYFVLN